MLTAISTPSTKVDSAITLALLGDHHAEALLYLVNKNRVYLREWLPWVDNMQSVQNFHDYIARCKKQQEEGTDYGYMIMVNDKPAGRIGIHYIDKQNRTAAIGYWLHEEFSGKGIVTKACIALINLCFTQLNLNRVEIKCATGNSKSAAIAERLNFTKEGVLRQAELVNGQFLDLNLYSMLKEEWTAKQNSLP